MAGAMLFLPVVRRRSGARRSDGSVTVRDPEARENEWVRVVRDGQDRLYVAVTVGEGTSLGASGSTTLEVRRFSVDGQPDTVFGTEGLLSLEFPGITSGFVVDDQAQQLVVSSVRITEETTADGNLDVSFKTFVSRFGIDGIPDPGFGDAGRVNSSIVGRELLLEPDGDILMTSGGPFPVFLGAAPSPSDPCPAPCPTLGVAVVRIKADGSLDRSFGNEGLYTLSEEQSALGQTFVHDLAQDSAGNILLCGSAAPPAEGGVRRSVTLLSRLNADGAPDPSFGEQGVVLHDFDGEDACRIAVPQNDGSIGLVSIASELLHIARLRTDGSLDPVFAAGGLQTTALVADPPAEPALAQSDGRLILTRSERVAGGGGPVPVAGPRDLILSRAEGSPELSEAVSRRGSGGGLGLAMIGVLGLAAFLRRRSSCGCQPSSLQRGLGR
ncbi:MAG: hypothetical protein ACT4PZ_22095 [Panacagrimonas sp.]